MTNFWYIHRGGAAAGEEMEADGEFMAAVRDAVAPAMRGSAPAGAAAKMAYYEGTPIVHLYMGHKFGKKHGAGVPHSTAIRGERKTPLELGIELDFNFLNREPVLHPTEASVGNDVRIGHGDTLTLSRELIQGCHESEKLSKLPSPVDYFAAIARGAAALSGHALDESLPAHEQAGAMFQRAFGYPLVVVADYKCGASSHDSFAALTTYLNTLGVQVRIASAFFSMDPTKLHEQDVVGRGQVSAPEPVMHFFGEPKEGGLTHALVFDHRVFAGDAVSVNAGGLLERVRSGANGWTMAYKLIDIARLVFLKRAYNLDLGLWMMEKGADARAFGLIVKLANALPDDFTLGLAHGGILDAATWPIAPQADAELRGGFQTMGGMLFDLNHEWKLLGRDGRAEGRTFTKGNLIDGILGKSGNFDNASPTMPVAFQPMSDAEYKAVQKRASDVESIEEAESTRKHGAPLMSVDGLQSRAAALWQRVVKK